MTFAIITLAIAAIILMTTAVITWPRRHTAHWILPFLGLATSVTIWLIGYALELSVIGLENKVFWAQVEYMGIAFTPVAWFVFAYQFLNNAIRNRNTMSVLLSILPLITISIGFTNDQHSLLWTQTILDESGAFPMLAVSYGGWFWIHSAYSYLLIIGGIGLFLRTIKLYPDPFRWQAVVLILAAATPALGNILYLTGNSPIPQVDLTPFAFALSALLIIWGVVRLDLFDIIPIARRVIVESLPDGIILLDMQNRILDANAQGKKLLNPTSDHLIGRMLPELSSEIAQKLTGYEALEVDDEIAIGDESHGRHFNLQIRPFFITGLHPRARIIILRDISRRIAAEAGIRQRNIELQQLFTEAQTARETAEKANMAKGELLAKVSHELRTPLGAILGYAEMMQEAVYGPITDDQDRSLTRIIENSGYLNEQVKDLLDLSRINSGTIDVELYEFNLGEALEQARIRLETFAEAKDLDLFMAVSPDLPTMILGNPIRLQQILVNLVTNAIKFTQKGKVTVTAEKADVDHWCLKVSDTGKGIPEYELQNIFQPFHQLDRAMTQEQSGVGLGLAIVHELTAALGGTIFAESVVNKGSTFTATFPLNPNNTVNNIPRSIAQNA